MHPQVNETRLTHVKNFTGKATMRRLFLTGLLIATAAAWAQAPNRSAELDKAYEETRAAYVELQAAEARRDQGVEAQPGERSGTVSGASRPNENYLTRQAILEQDVANARKRYEAALKRWNDLK
jgi:hypothetical protein